MNTENGNNNYVGGDNDEMYAKMTKLWLNDADSVEDKVYIYFSEVSKED